MPTIDIAGTGDNIRSIMKQKNMKIADIQSACGFNTPQAIYKWIQGRSVPTIDNMIILADIFGVSIDDIIVIKRVG